uniref:Zinc finger transcriptional regulator n=1 Tax=Hypocrea virens TaxID=29875 RepID=A9Q1D7_HYPVI|nr:zinc finger transcriptional regulator [Trichoderma virens]
MSRDQAVTPKFLESDKQPKLRSACDGCHAAKIRCTGGTPCARCARENLRCHYSFKAKIGKPKGSLNKKTIERMQQMAKPAGNNQRAPPSEATAPRSETLATIPYAANNLLLSPVSGESTTADVVLLPQNSHEIQDTISSKPLALGHSDNLVYEGDDLDGMENWHSMVAASSIEMVRSTLTTVRNLPKQPHTQLVRARPCSAGIFGASGRIYAIEATANHPQDQDPDSSRTTNKIPIGYEDDSSFWRNTTFSQISGAIDPSFSQLSPYSSKSTPSGQIDRQCSNHASILSPYAGPSPPHTHPSSPCTCFAMLSSRLCELQALSIATEQARAIDSLLVQSQTTIPYIKTLFKCHNCMRDTQGLLMATMVLSRLLTWTRLSLIDQELGLISAQVRLGKFTGSRELGIMVTRLLLRTHWLDRGIPLVRVNCGREFSCLTAYHR